MPVGSGDWWVPASCRERDTACNDVLRSQAARQRLARKRSAKLNTRQRKLAKQGIYVDLDELEAALHGTSQYVLHL